jgi:hypothetical protein
VQLRAVSAPVGASGCCREATYEALLRERDESDGVIRMDAVTATGRVILESEGLHYAELLR